MENYDFRQGFKMLGHAAGRPSRKPGSGHLQTAVDCNLAVVGVRLVVAETAFCLGNIVRDGSIPMIGSSAFDILELELPKGNRLRRCKGFVAEAISVSVSNGWDFFQGR